MSSRFTKWGASHAMDTRMGRAMLTDALPPNIQGVIDAFNQAFSKHQTAAKAKTINKDMLKIAIKVNLLLTGTAFSVKDEEAKIEAIQEAINDFVFFLDEEKETPEEKKQAAAAMNKTLAALHGLACEMFVSHMRAKNITKLGHLIDEFSEMPFLHALCYEQKLAGEKKTILEGLRHAVQATANRRALLMCTERSCKHTRCKPEGKFQGSKYCEAHHYRHYAMKVKNPRVEHWLQQELMCAKFYSFLKEQKKRRIVNSTSSG